ncbi:MAG: NAD(P)/FAD-dependent oxidoreductase [Acidobacteriota bacterium]
MDFFERYIVPSLVGHIDYECVVESIDYSNKEINVQTSKGIKRADKVILTAPVKTLQQGAIEFRPPLPKSKQKAIDKVRVWDGCKAFIQFTNAFYPTLYSIGIKPSSAGQKLFYDAAYGQRSSQNVLGLFAVGVAAHQYQSFDDESRIDFLLSELDELFDGQASPNYVKHVFQNWTAEPYARGAYVLDYENWRRVRTLGRSVGGRLFFAGDAYTTGEDWSSVHAAARSAQRAVQEILTLGN